MKTWFITGTSSGFGRIMTEQLLARGDRVAATLRQPAQLDELRAGAEDRLWTAELDVTRPDDVRRVVDEAFAHFGRLDVVVNNAGYALYAAIEEPSREQVRRVIDTDLMGSIDVIRAALPHLRAQGGGRILQVSSAGGQTTYPGFGLYHAAKWGIEGFCETLAAEVAQFGIGVTIAEPGATPTGFTAAKDTAPAMTEYDGGAFGAARRAQAAGLFRGPNDATAIVAAMIASADAAQAPLRLPLGVDTYKDLHAAYLRRLELLEASRALANSVVANSLPNNRGRDGPGSVLRGVVPPITDVAKGLVSMARKNSGRRRVSRWVAAGAAGAVVAAGIGLGASSAGAAAGPTWSTTGPQAVGGTVSAVTSLQYGNSKTTEWAFVTTAFLTGNKGYPSVWTHTGTEKWARSNLPGSAPGETFNSATAIGPANVLAFANLPDGTSREWQFNGSTWKVIKTFGAPVGGSSVTSATNVWVFGSATASRQLGVWRYNGTTWNQVASTLHGGQSLSYSSAYAYTGTTIAQWNGTAWTGTNLARFIPGSTAHLVDVFDRFGTLYAVGESTTSLVVLAYAGHTWTRVGQLNGGLAADVNQISSDGGGGIWIPVVDGAKQGAAEVLHYIRSVNKLTVTSLPGSALSITRVDATFQLIGGSGPSGKSDPATYLELEYYD